MKIVDRSYSQQYVTAEVSRKVEVELSYHINPTFGYQSIDSGLVTVQRILYYDSIQTDASDMLEQVQEHIRGELSMWQGRGKDSYRKYLEESIWVVYYYNKNIHDLHVLPLDTFVRHTIDVM